MGALSLVSGQLVARKVSMELKEQRVSQSCSEKQVPQFFRVNFSCLRETNFLSQTRTLLSRALRVLLEISLRCPPLRHLCPSPDWNPMNRNCCSSHYSYRRHRHRRRMNRNQSLILPPSSSTRYSVHRKSLMKQRDNEVIWLRRQQQWFPFSKYARFGGPYFLPGGGGG